MLRGKIFEINKEIKVGGQICPPPGMNRVKMIFSVLDIDNNSYYGIYESFFGTFFMLVQLFYLLYYGAQQKYQTKNDSIHNIQQA